MNNRRLSLRIFLAVILCIFVLGVILVNSTASAPRNFPTGTLFSIEEGMTLSDIAKSLKDHGFIRSKTALKVITHIIYMRGNEAVAGEYFFERRLSAFSLAKRIVNGEYHLVPIKVTIPEGLNKFEMARILEKQLPDFDSKKFLELAKEGYLFPDTYFFIPNISAEKVVDEMEQNFDDRTTDLSADIEASGRTLDEIIKMASIVETEARQTETRKTIAGILWKRLDNQMPLQVDVSFKYINGKTTEELSTDDLEIDSPYNTYVNLGLPPTPIANPGFDSILATLHPIETDYVYFLTDSNGVMHYARNFEEHKANKIKYLK